MFQPVSSNIRKNSLYLNIIEREEADHGVVLSFVPILVDLASHEYYVPSSEAELPATHLQSIILLHSYCDGVHHNSHIIGLLKYK